MKIILPRFATKKGFTLIELLVVIAIIALLSSVVMSSVSSARMKSRDAKKTQDLYQIRTALGLYFDTNNHYPIVATWMCSNNATNWGILQTELSPYIAKLPKDPLNTAGSPWVTGQYAYCYGWTVTAQHTDYDLVTQLEDRSNQNRCQIKGWLYHRPGSPVSTDKNRPWCAGFANAWAYSPYLYADH